MKLLEKEKIATRTAHAVVVAPRPVERPVRRPVAKPQIAVRARVASKAAQRNRALAEISTRTVVFASILGATYFASTLGGYVVLERARQSARHGAERAVYARAQAKEARESIETLTNPTVLRAWAETHGFVAGSTIETPNVQPQAEGLVARR